MAIIKYDDYVYTAGKTTDGASSSSNSSDKKVASSATVDFDGTLQTLVARVWLSSAGSTSVRAIIYSDSSGAPGTKLAVSDDISLTATSENAVSFSFTGANQISLTPTTYWIGLHWKDPGAINVTFSRDNTANLRVEAADVFDDGTSSTWGTAEWYNGKIDAYITYNKTSISTYENTLITYDGNSIIAKIISETFAVSESVVKSTTRIVSETFAISESVLKSITRTLSETFAVSEIISKASTFARTLVETFKISEVIRKLVNGSTTLWTKRTKPTTSWTGRSKPSTSWTGRTKPTTNWTNRTKP